MMKKALSLLLALALLFAALPMTAAAADTSDLADTGAAAYGLWLGSTQVTGFNMNDILADGGSAKFDPDTNTLTLNAPTITGEHNYSTIYCSGFDLTVKGLYSMSQAQSDNAITVFDHNLTLDGYFTFVAWSEAVKATYDITVSGGSLAAKLEDGSSDQFGAIVSDAGDLIFGDDVEGVHAEVTGTSSTLCAVNYATNGSVSMSSKLRLATPEGGSFREGKCSYYSSGRTRIAKKVIIVPAAPSDVTYGVWVGNTQVSLANKDDVLGDGKAQYDPATNTLTLNSPIISGSYSKGGKTHKIYSDHDLTVKGSYYMNSYTEDYGLDCYGNLTLDGEFIFLGSLYGVHALYDIDIAGGALTAKSSSTTFTDSAGIYSHDGKIVIDVSVSSIEAEGKKTYAIYANRGLTIPSGSHVVEPESSTVTKETVVELAAGGDTIAKYVVIEPYASWEITYGVWVGSTQVNSGNKDDILNDGGKVKYDPEDRILTMDGASVSGDYEGSAIYSDGNLTLRGSGSVRGSSAGVNVKGTLNIRGDFTLSGKRLAGVITKGDLHILSGAVKASGAMNGVNCGGHMFVYNHGENTRLEAESDTAALYAKEGLEVDAELTITEPDGGSYVKPSVREADGETVATRVVIGSSVTKYDLWVGGTQVTSDNKDDILSDGGKAKYDPDTRTLTLNDPVIPDAPSSDDDYYYVIKAREIDLTVAGSYHMTGDEGYDYGINVYLGDLTLSGDFTFISRGVAVASNSGNDLTIASGSLKAVTLASGNSVVICKNLTIAPGVTRVEAENSFGNGSAFNIYEAISIPDDLAIVYPSSASIDENGKLVSADGDRICHVLIAPTDTPVDIVANYPLWVSNIQVTSENKDDILGDGGRAKYDPDTKTLIFDEPELTDYYVVDKYNSALIYSEVKSLTIKGSWHMTSASEDGIIYASDNSSRRNCSLTFSGDFYLKAEGDNIFVDGDLTLASGSLTVEGQLYTSGKLIIEEAATGFEYTGDRLETDYGYVIPENLCIIEPAGGMVKGYYIYENDGVTEATHVVIGPNPDKPIVIVRKYPVWLGSTQVTDENLDDILGDGGKAKFDPETKTLTLNDPVLTGYTVGPSNSICLINATDTDLIIKGKWDSSSSNEDVLSDINVGGNLTLSGDFTLTQGSMESVLVVNSITIASGRVTGSMRMYAGGAFTVGDAAEYVEVGGISCKTGIIIPDNLSIITPEDSVIKEATVHGSFKEISVYESDGETKATHVVIESKQAPVSTALLGDADGSGKVNVFDAAYVQKATTGTKGYPDYKSIDKNSEQFKIADVDKNGAVNIFDAALIQKYTTGDKTAKAYGIGELLKG